MGAIREIKQDDVIELSGTRNLIYLGVKASYSEEVKY